MKTIQERITAQLESNSSVVPPEVAAAALAEYNKLLENEQRTTMIRRLGSVKQHTSDAVNILRDVRKKEKLAKALVDTLASAEEKYQQDGNWDAYSKARTEAQYKFDTQT